VIQTRSASNPGRAGTLVVVQTDAWGSQGKAAPHMYIGIGALIIIILIVIFVL
jgi:hypothetical protein